MPLKRITAILLTCFGCVAVTPAAGAVTLVEMLNAIDGGDSAVTDPCLETDGRGEVPASPPEGSCATLAVTWLYLGLLRDRDRLQLLGDAIAYHRRVLEAMQRRLEGGGGSYADTLKAEVELKRWQRREAALVRDIRRRELFFSKVMVADPAQFRVPGAIEAAWPEDETAALTALAERQDLSEGQRTTLETVLGLAWVDLQALQREIALLEPMIAFARELLIASEQNFKVSQVTLQTVVRHVADLAELEEALMEAKYRQLVLQVRVLDLLGRRAALQ